MMNPSYEVEFDNYVLIVKAEVCIVLCSNETIVCVALLLFVVTSVLRQQIMINLKYYRLYIFTIDSTTIIMLYRDSDGSHHFSCRAARSSVRTCSSSDSAANEAAATP